MPGKPIPKEPMVGGAAGGNPEGLAQEIGQQMNPVDFDVHLCNGLKKRKSLRSRDRRGRSRESASAPPVMAMIGEKAIGLYRFRKEF
jgi:hypothetical protein